MDLSKFGRTALFVLMFILFLAGVNMLIRMGKPAIKNISPTAGAVLDFAQAGG